MCSPALAIGQMVGTALQIQQAMGNFKAQQASAEALYKANKGIAEDDAIRQYAALQARQTQEHSKAAIEVDRIHQEATRRASLERTVAASSGVIGSDVQGVLDEFKRSELQYQTTVSRNTAMLDANFANQGLAVQSQEQGRILQGLPGPMQSPDVLGMALSGAGKSLQIFNQFDALKPTADVGGVAGGAGGGNDFFVGGYHSPFNFDPNADYSIH